MRVGSPDAAAFKVSWLPQFWGALGGMGDSYFLVEADGGVVLAGQYTSASATDYGCTWSRDSLSFFFFFLRNGFL